MRGQEGCCRSASSKMHFSSCVPIHSDPIHSDPIRSDPIHSAPIHSDPIHSNPIHSNAYMLPAPSNLSRSSESSASHGNTSTTLSPTGVSVVGYVVLTAAGSESHCPLSNTHYPLHTTCYVLMCCTAPLYRQRLPRLRSSLVASALSFRALLHLRRPTPRSPRCAANPNPCLLTYRLTTGPRWRQQWR